MSEVWEDLGTKEKPKDKVLSRIPPSPIPRHSHESEEMTSKRRARCLEAIFRVTEDVHLDEIGKASFTIAGKKFECWTASDTYYIDSSRTYGTDIERLCEQIKNRLVNT